MAPRKKAAVKKRAPAKKKVAAKKTRAVKPAKTITLKDKEFCDLYRSADPELRGNGKKCYMQLHPKTTDRTAEVEASRILRKPEITEYLIQKSLELEKNTDITVEKVLQEWGKIGFSNVQDLFDEIGRLIPPQNLPRELAACITEVQIKTILGEDGEPGALTEYKYKLSSKQNALDSIAKYFQMFVERKEIVIKKDVSTMSEQEMDEYEAKLEEELARLEEEERLAHQMGAVH